MRAFVVIVIRPSIGDLPDFSKAVEDIGIEHFTTIGSVEAFNVGILSGFTRLDVANTDVLVPAVV